MANQKQVSDKMFSLPTGSKVEEFKVIISQPPDCCAEGDLDNMLEIETPDGGAGNYITIKGRWAMDNDAEIDELAAMLKEVLRKSK